ncbi:hypothetical protein HDE_07351 [Halotydeus destructor]|nr:hypothetical protein HDE_07351 [Halotydeus destructor]
METKMEEETSANVDHPVESMVHVAASELPHSRRRRLGPDDDDDKCRGITVKDEIDDSKPEKTEPVQLASRVRKPTREELRRTLNSLLECEIHSDNLDEFFQNSEDAEEENSVEDNEESNADECSDSENERSKENTNPVVVPLAFPPLPQDLQSLDAWVEMNRARVSQIYLQTLNEL